MTPLRRRLLALAGCLALVASTLLSASPAHAAVPDVWAFAYMDNPAPAPGSVTNTAYQWGTYRSTCPGSWITVTQIAIGKYQLKLPCSASTNGIVHVTAVNDNARYCDIENWFDSGGTKVVTVLCFKGNFQDNSAFTMTYMRSSGGPVGGGAHAYVYSNMSGGVLASYNSTGAANSITHTGTGTWTVKFAGLSTGGYDGDLQATAVHPNDMARRCRVDNWYFSGTDYLVPVSCTDSNGAPVDTWWTASYHLKRSVFGAANPPTRLAYQTNLTGAPAGSSYNSLGASNTFGSAPPGRYTMVFPAVGVSRTHLQVTALGGPSGYYCNLEKTWTISGSDVLAPVICFNNVGVPTDNLLFSTYSSEI
ncbi:hypothetical protein Lfu02_43270 [Longispora fulva]|uniref:Uncharacterized protein n=1 Tax=Longispora fulva TaxID=619741 RepID=A0A8J7GPZ0_9ACTN|nr:hypothetical protein [Longispora fulva]MBG6136784.1 hypothetical protein [Longispora fulva]GIG59955.1 hypothetical protein Lfu02_43270 [Longispora fulva]